MKKIILSFHACAHTESMKGATHEWKVPFRACESRTVPKFRDSASWMGGFRSSVGKKIVLTVSGFLFLVSCCLGQEIGWQNTIGGSAQDQLYSIQQTSDGGYILGGWSMSDISGDKTENSNGFNDYWLVKTDSLGNVQWQNTIGGSSDDELHSIRQTSDGGYILGGYSHSNISGDKSENSINFDYWIVKTDASGNIQWQNTIGGNNSEFLYSIQQTSDGGYILGGSSASNISGDKTENCNGGVDYWIIKTDASGNIQWQNTIGGGYSDDLYSIQQTSDGGYILGGSSNSQISGDKTENSNGGFGDNDYWIVKTDASGNIQWQNTIGGNHEDYFSSMYQTSDGGYILGGFSASDISGDKTKNSNGFHDYWIVKTDASGNIQWDNTFGGNDEDYLYSIQQTSDGGYILGGYSWSNISGDKTENSNGCYDYWIIKTDVSGNIKWQNTIGGSNYDQLYCIQQTSDGYYILGGWSTSNVSGDKTESSNGSQDYWIIKMTDKINSITGKLFIDANSNTMQDAGEPSVINKQVTEINTGMYCFSAPNGHYSVTVLDTGNFSVSPASLNYYNIVPATHTANFNSFFQTDSLNDFAFQPAGVFNDLCVTITPMGNFRANMNANYIINYENAGTTTLNGTVIFFPDDNITYVSSNPTATSVTTDSVVWNVGTLTPFQTGSILVTVHVNAGTLIGTLINSSVVIEPVAGDANTVCNYNAWEVYTTGSYDPNAIIVDRDTVLTTDLSSPPYLNYIIYFQNTGNDTAFNVRVLNPIDTFKLDIHSFEFVASSHPVNINYKIWERNMEFTLDNIFLPDSNVNEPASHGFVRYRIKPLSTLVAGDSIKNNAAIYFDFNLPVLTDTAVTEIVLPTGIGGQMAEGSWQLAIFPNPSDNLITVKFSHLTTGKGQLTIFDLFGRAVFQSEILNPESKIKIDVSELAKGIYLIEINSAEKIYRGKFVKE